LSVTGTTVLDEIKEALDHAPIPALANADKKYIACTDIETSKGLNITHLRITEMKNIVITNTN